MAQQRLRDYQDPLGSYQHNLVNLGIHFPGRFCGFDNIVFTGQYQFSLGHALSGVNTYTNLGDPYGPLGVVMSKQGVIITEDTPIPALSIESNTGNANDRIDLVCLNHEYLEITGGADANYTVVKGPVNQTIRPGITSFQTVVGSILIPAQADNINLCTYTKEPCPDSGDSPDAKLTVPNTYRAINQNAQEPKVLTVPTILDGVNNLWDLSTNGNSFIISPANTVDIDGLRIKGGSNQDGTEITLSLNQYTRIKNNMPLSPANRNNGYAPIMFSSSLIAGTTIVNGIQTNILQPAAGQATLWIASLIKLNGVWYVKAVDGPGFPHGGFIKGMSLQVQMKPIDLPLNFDGFGAGIGTWAGWQISNSQQGTLDLRGAVQVNATDTPSGGVPIPGNRLPAGKAAYNNYIESGGVPEYIMTRAQLPNEGIRIVNQTGGDYVYYDTGGGGNKLSLKGDSDNSTNGGFMVTEALGQGAKTSLLQPYVVTFTVVKL